MTDFLIGRQQILDNSLNTYAYEILFRGNQFDLNAQDGATSATNQVITDTILEIGLNNLVGPHLAFINFTTQNLLDKTPLNLPKDRIVVEVLESVTVDPAIVKNLQELSALGYTIALDDFVLTPEWLPLLEIADIIKLDIMAGTLNDSKRLIEQLRPYSLKLLAEKVETYEQFQTLRDWGCEYFQGFFFSKPNVVEGKRLGVSQSASLQLMGTLNKPDVEFADITALVSQDLGLSYKLLHYINSAFFALPYRIESINQAITCLGLREIKRWLNILTLSNLSDKPSSVLQVVLIRAKMCELLAREIDQDAEMFFLVGMFNGLDALLDIPLEKALQQLPLSQKITDAVLLRTGIAGEALQYTLDYERWDIKNATFHDIAPQRIRAIYLESIEWWSRHIYPLVS
jgi:EAL and modified HD-GYP domain-containing signal transduction protein